MTTFPEGLFIKVIDRDNGNTVKTKDNEFSFVSEKYITKRHFALIVNDSEPESEYNDPAPEKFILARCYPNPFNPQTTIHYELSMSGKVVISVYNAVGQQVRIYDAGYKDRGVHELVFDASNLTSGIYFYHFDAGYASVTGKMLYMK